MGIYSGGVGRSRGWGGMKYKRPEFKRWTKEEFDVMKERYVDQFGYTITVPDWEDVMRWKPDYMMTELELKERGIRQFSSILASPEPKWNSAYASIMTAIDNVQDMVSSGFVLSTMLYRAAPKVLGRFIPYLGWALLGLDILNLINSIGRTPFSPMGAKRQFCKHVRKNPFSKNMQKSRVDRLKKLRPTLGSLLELGQVSYDMTGVGLALGSLTGFVSNLAFGAYRRLTGESVRISREPASFTLMEKKANTALATSSLITSENPLFTEDFHHKTYFGLTLANYIMAPWLSDSLIDELVDEPTKKLIPAPCPTNKITISIIESYGLTVENGVRWPAYGDKMMPAVEICDWHEEMSQPVFHSYLKKHKYNSMGMLCGGEYANSLPTLYDGVDPETPTTTELEPVYELMTQYLRTPIIFDSEKSPGDFHRFGQWVKEFHLDHGQLPNVHYARKKGEEMGIVWKSKYPATLEGDAAEIFPDWKEQEASSKNIYLDGE